MTIRNIEDLKHILPKQGRVIGLDLGSKTIGVAISDLGRLIASPYKTITRKKFRKDCENIASIIEHQQIAGVILGYPINMDDTDSKLSLKVSKFKIACEQLFDIDVELEDERLTTWEAKKIMSDKNNLTDKKTTSHALAAKIILDTWLNKK